MSDSWSVSRTAVRLSNKLCRDYEWSNMVILFQSGSMCSFRMTSVLPEDSQSVGMFSSLPRVWPDMCGLYSGFSVILLAFFEFCWFVCMPQMLV